MLYIYAAFLFHTTHATELLLDRKSLGFLPSSLSLVPPDEGIALSALAPSVSHPFLGMLSKVAPRFAGRIGYALLLKSGLTEELDEQKQLRDRARISLTPHVHFYGGRSGKEGAGRRLMMYEWGSGPTVLMVNGWGERATQMVRMIEHFIKAGFRVVAFERPPNVDANVDTHDANATASDLIEFSTAIHVAAQAAGNLHAIVGHSFGAAMAMAAVRDWGDFASRHVWISPIDHRQWINHEFSLYRQLSLHVVMRMREVVDSRYGHQVNWDQLALPELLRANRRPALLIHDENDADPAAAPLIDYLLTSRLSPAQQSADPVVIARVIRFLHTDKLLTPQVRNERLIAYRQTLVSRLRQQLRGG